MPGKRMILIAKFIRLLSKLVDHFRSRLVILYLQLKYPGCSLAGCKLGRSVRIVCTDGASLNLKNCYISSGASITVDHGGCIEAEECFFGAYSVTAAINSIKIGRLSLISEMVVIRDQNHRFSDRNTPISEQGFDVEPVIIGQNVWIGTKSTVLAGASIGEGTVIGAHSLVKGDIPPFCLAVGAPAFVKKRVD